MDTYTIRGLMEGQEEEVRVESNEEHLVHNYSVLVEAGMRPISIVPSYEPEGPAHSIYECGGYTFSSCSHGDCFLVTTPSGEMITESFEELAVILDKAGYGRKE